MRCLVLGGGGFLGPHLSQALLGQGHTVRIFERPNLRRDVALSKNPNIEFIEGDFVNEQDVTNAVPGCDVIFHLISTTVPKSSNDNPVYDIESNVIGTLHLLRSAVKNEVRKILFASSGGTVYGVPKEVPISESHPTDPVCSYAIGKLAVEKYLYLYHALYGLDYCALRIANAYGEGQRPFGSQGAVAVFLKKAMNDEVIEIWGDGKVVRDYIYVGDVIDAFLRAMSYEGEHRLFNVGAGEGRSINELLSTIESLIGRPVCRKYLRGRSFDVPVNVLDIGRARAALDWEPKISFCDGLARTLEWFRSHG